MEPVRATGVKGREGQNDEGHYLIHGGAEEQTTNQRVLGHKTQLAAGREINCRRGARDKEVQADAQYVGANASTDSLPAEQTGGDHEWNPPSKKDASLKQIQGSGNPSAHGDGQESVAFSRRPRCRIFTHEVSSRST